MISAVIKHSISLKKHDAYLANYFTICLNKDFLKCGGNSISSLYPSVLQLISSNPFIVTFLPSFFLPFLSFPLSSLLNPFQLLLLHKSFFITQHKETNKQKCREEEEAGHLSEAGDVLEEIGLRSIQAEVRIEGEWMRKKTIQRVRGREQVIICILRGSWCMQQCVCFISAQLALWEGVWAKASGHILQWWVQWWMFIGNLGHCSRNTINSVSQHNWEEV